MATFNMQNVSVGDHCQLGDINIERPENIDWDLLLETVNCYLENTKSKKRKDVKMAKKVKDYILNRDKKSLKEYLKSNWNDFCVGVLSGMASSGVIEVFKQICL